MSLIQGREERIKKAKSTPWITQIISDRIEAGTVFLIPVSTLLLFYFLTLQYCTGFAIYQNESATGIHVFPILNPPPTSLPLPSLWVVPVHQPQASSIVHRTWTGIRSVAQSCPTLCDPMNSSTPGLPVHHQLPEFTQTHFH